MWKLKKQPISKLWENSSKYLWHEACVTERSLAQETELFFFKTIKIFEAWVRFEINKGTALLYLSFTVFITCNFIKNWQMAACLVTAEI